MPLFTLRRRYYKPVWWMLRHNVAPHNVLRRCKLIDGSYATGDALNTYDEETAYESYMNPEPGFQSGPGDYVDAD